MTEFEKAERAEQNLTSAATEAHIRLEESGKLSFLEIFRAGAEWQKAKMEHIADVSKMIDHKQ